VRGEAGLIIEKRCGLCFITNKQKNRKIPSQDSGDQGSLMYDDDGFTDPYLDFKATLEERGTSSHLLVLPLNFLTIPKFPRFTLLPK
jgi:hypothetical protein